MENMRFQVYIISESRKDIGLKPGHIIIGADTITEAEWIINRHRLNSNVLSATIIDKKANIQ